LPVLGKSTKRTCSRLSSTSTRNPRRRWDSKRGRRRCHRSPGERNGSPRFATSDRCCAGAAWFSVDRRFNPEEELEQELARLTDTIAEAAAAVDAEVTVDVLQRAPSASTSEEHPASVALARCIAQVEGAAPPFELCPGALEIRWYAELGIPAFAYGAGRLDVSHGPDEFIDEAAMRRCAAVYALFPGELVQ
jgi:acetylornithine deacetylase/succinyl-diaminopimelate desuccinylase-like protein